ncbi:iron complex transport system permease protein [Croceifilum oryzae]|uniref:Iron complex transport system permease protein n=1 Tax=Croceifilum oryzae TaxID=1553429 RepID=A0AAJ1TMF2_9BACL|nr:iron ABC transporter permease [Croceifilum oryzae]MDQ0418581.1 iron complex transport system permease protein [Croceifilum oryzae]
MDKFKSNVRLWYWFILLFFALVAGLSMLISVVSGAISIPISDVWSVLTSSHSGSPSQDIIWNIRFPRTIVAALVGMNLALSGALLQGSMRNSMADPYIMGVSSGAGLFGMMILIVFPSYGYLLTPVAFVGGMVAALLVYLLAWRNGVNPMRVMLVGVAVSAFLSSGISGLLTFYSDRVESALTFMVGGLSTRSWPHIEMLLPYTVIGLILAFIGSQRMNILMLGDSEAKSLGLRVEAYRLYFTAIAALLAASAVSVVGLLGFVGLIVPHIARLLVGSDYRILLPVSALLGITVLTLSDTLARIIFAPIELPVGIVMGMLGAPFFVYLIRRKGV